MEPAANKLALELERVRFRDLEAARRQQRRSGAQRRRSADQPSCCGRQVTAPVRFSEIVTRLRGLGVDRFLEVGPGCVLSGLIARIERRSKTSRAFDTSRTWTRRSRSQTGDAA